MSNKPDIDPQETQEWLDALEAVLENEGVERAHFLLESLIDKARRSGAYLPYSANTAYLSCSDQGRFSAGFTPRSRP
jgi:pyruvate dehydrogenase E1 component